MHWIDLFTRNECKHIILDSLQYCRKNKGLVIHGWVLMSSHLHLIVSSEKEPLEAILRDFKKHTSKQIVRTIGEINESRNKWLLRAFAKAAEEVKRVKLGFHNIHLPDFRLSNEVPFGKSKAGIKK